jgi:hypothetical protein
MKDVLKKIIYGAEITTVNGKEAYLNQYRKASQKIDIHNINILILLDILEFDSGNFETGERHFRLGESFYSIMDNIKTIHLNRIGKCIESNKPTLYPGFNELEKAYNDLRNQLIRKEKLKKIQSYGSNELL